MSKGGSRLSRVGVLAPAALSACIDASVLAAPAAGAILSTVLKELSKAFMLKNWFHGVMSSQEAEHLLLQKGKHGSYLVRESRAHPGEYVLSVRVRARVSHVMIRREQNKYDVGSGEIFDDLAGVIEHCRAYPLREASGEVLRLRQPVSGARASSRHIPDKDNNKKPAVPTLAPAPTKPEPIKPEAKPGQKMDFETEEVIKEQIIDSRLPQNFEEQQIVPDELDTYKIEYNCIRNCDQDVLFTKFEGRRTVNRYKNRYRDILPYDQTRVSLPRTCYSLDEGYSDYINASFIRPEWMFQKLEPALAGEEKPLRTFHGSDWEDVFEMEKTGSVGRKPNLFASGEPLAEMRAWEQGHNKFYIATQGCLAATRHAFWTMIADNDVRVIAMLTQCVENDKCKSDMYWPPLEKTEELGDMKLVTLGEYEHDHYTSREIMLTLAGKHTTIYHYQYRAWPDHDIPEDKVALNRYLRDVNDRMRMVAQENGAPKHNILCVQCSAGIGRTGTFIAVDMLTDLIKREGLHNFNLLEEVPKVVVLLRKQRPGMVQNEAQYRFIFAAIINFIANFGTLSQSPHNSF